MGNCCLKSASQREKGELRRLLSTEKSQPTSTELQRAPQSSLFKKRAPPSPLEVNFIDSVEVTLFDEDDLDDEEEVEPAPVVPPPTPQTVKYLELLKDFEADQGSLGPEKLRKLVRIASESETKLMAFVEALRRQNKKSENQKETYAKFVDWIIRINPGFNSSNPTAFQLHSHMTIELCNDYRLANNIDKITHETITKSDERFLIVKNANGDEMISVRHLTPYQESDKHYVYGYFKCFTCSTTWESAASWKNMYQKCAKCDSIVYPYEQHVLNQKEREQEMSQKSLHDCERCQKCILLRRICNVNMDGTDAMDSPRPGVNKFRF